nr:LYR motif-containing protein 4 [Parasteatoda tepidariorum]
MASRRMEVLRLYKNLLREAGKFSSYMYRTYSLRRIKDAFKDYKDVTDQEKLADLITYGKSNLEIIKRQVIISQLFKDPENVIEKHLKDKKTQT